MTFERFELLLLAIVLSVAVTILVLIVRAPKREDDEDS